MLLTSPLPLWVAAGGLVNHQAVLFVLLKCFSFMSQLSLFPSPLFSLPLSLLSLRGSSFPVKLCLCLSSFPSPRFSPSLSPLCLPLPSINRRIVCQEALCKTLLSTRTQHTMPLDGLEPPLAGFDNICVCIRQIEREARLCFLSACMQCMILKKLCISKGIRDRGM